MDTTKNKIVIVAGDIANPRLLSMFEGFQGTEHDVSVFAIQKKTSMASDFSTSLKMCLFEEIKDMPGYMRSLEEKLADADLVIALETSKLSTFQAVRAAKKTSRPIAIIVNEFHPYFYVNYANIRAVQIDVMENADRFWPTSSLASSMLKIDGVDKGKICTITPAVDTKRFLKSEQNRAKFRKYVGMQSDDFVILFHDDLDAENKPMDVLHAYKLLYTTNPKLAEKIKILFAGTGGSERELKYRCYDLGISKSVLFLHQDPELFLQDMYAASDAIVSLRKLKNEQIHEAFPLQVLEAMSCGVVPVVSAGTVANELAQNYAVTLPDESYQSLAIVVADLFKDPEKLESAKEKTSVHIRNSFSNEQAMRLLNPEIESMLGLAKKMRSQSFDYKEAIANVRRLMDRGDLAASLVKIEDLLLREIPSFKLRAEILLCKGDAHFGLIHYNEAVEAYGESLKLDDRNYLAYRGLGNVAYKGHSHEEAVTFFKKALALKEDDSASMLSLGLVLRRIGLNEQAIYWYERSINLNQNNASAQSALVQTCLESPATSFSIKILERLIDNIGEKPALVMTLGQLYLKEGKTELGNQMVQKALAMNGQDSNAA